MRKFLLPIINLVNLILISITWGISNQTAIIDAGHNDAKSGTFYDMTWMGTKPNAVAIVAFFLFIVACALTLVAFLPLKVRKYITCVAGAFYIAAGIMFVNAPWSYDRSIVKIECTGALIAMACLVIIAGAFSLCMSIIEFLPKKESK